MELRHLRYFVAVAEEENIRRAAKRLHIVQPALSRQMHQMEEEMECALFDRLPRGIRLNAAGKAFLESAREILSRTDEAVAHTRRVAQGEAGQLHIGFIESASWFGVFPQVDPAISRTLSECGSLIFAQCSRPISLRQLSPAGSMPAFATLSKPRPKAARRCCSEWTRSCSQCRDTMAGKSGAMCAWKI